MVIFKNISEQLIQALTALEVTYNDEREVERSRSLFLYMKEETENVFMLLDEWKETALHLSGERRIPIHPQQIDATFDNMKALIMHSYYKDVRKRRYMDIQKACHYIFTQGIEGMTE